MTFLKRLFGATKKTEHFDSKQADLTEEITECVKCGGRNFEHDSYWDEYTCENCGWTSKEKPKGKVKIRELQTKDKEKAGVGERASAADEFSEQEIRRSISDLVSENRHVRERAFKSLEKSGDAAVKPLIETLEHKNLMVRRQAAEALGMINTQACIQALLNVFSDQRPEMFRRANYALWLIGAPAVSPLVEKLRDNEPEVRIRAAMALGQMIHRRMADPSDLIWLDPSAIDATDNTREDIDVERVISEAKGPLKKLLQDEDESVRKYALYTLERGYVEPDREKEEEVQKRESVAQRKEAEMSASPLYVRQEERDEKRAEWLHKAAKLKKEGQHEKAIEYWDQVIKANLDKNGWAHYLKGCTLAEIDRPEEAAECLKDALELDPDSSSYALELGRVFHKLGRWDEARSAFKKVATMDGIVYGDDDKAMKWLEKISKESSFNLDYFAHDLGQRYPLDKYRGVIGTEALVDALRKVEHEISVFLSDKSGFGAGPSAFRVAVFSKGQSPSSTGGALQLEFFGLAEVYDTYNYLKEQGVTEEQIGLLRGRMSKFIFYNDPALRGLTDNRDNYQPVSIDEIDRRIRERQAKLCL